MLPLPRFQYAAPTSLDEAVALLAEHGTSARLVAGGTDLLPNLKHGLLEPSVLVSLSSIAGLDVIEEVDGELRLGATCRLADLRDHPIVRRRAAALAEAAGQVASPQIQNMGTLGGNLCLDTRCVFYNQTHFWRHALGYCLKKDGSVCHVVAGGRNCVAAASSDTAPALISLGASAVLTSQRGERVLSLADLYKSPGDDHLTLAHDEILSQVRIPAAPVGLRSGYEKLRIRKAIDFPIFGVAIALALDGERRLVSFGMAASALGPRPRVLDGLATQALGEVFDLAVVADIAEQARRKCVPLANINVDPEWRREVIPTLVRRLFARLLKPRA